MAEYELGKKLHSKTNDKEVLLMKESNRYIVMKEDDLSKETEVDLSKKMEVDSSKETEVDLSKKTKVDSSKETEVDLSQETEVDLSQETEVDLSKKTEVDSSKEIHGVTKPEPVLDRSKLKRKIKVPARFELEPEQIVIKKELNKKAKIVCSQFSNIDKNITDPKPKQDDDDLSKETEAEVQVDEQDNFDDANLGVTPVIADKNENSKIFKSISTNLAPSSRFQCPYCKSKFSQKHNLKRHVKQKHEENVESTKEQVNDDKKIGKLSIA